jgi:hypothetical protein
MKEISAGINLLSFLLFMVHVSLIYDDVCADVAFFSNIICSENFVYHIQGAYTTQCILNVFFSFIRLLHPC